MGKRGRPTKKTQQGRSSLGALGGIAKKAMGSSGGSSGGHSAGLYRLTRDGQMIRVQQKRRKKGYRMPRVVREAMESQRRLVDAMAMKMVSNA